MKKNLLSKGVFKKALAKLTLAAMLSLGCVQGASAQTIMVGNNTGTSVYYPIYNYYGYSYSQSIYLASELTTAGASGPAYITAIKYYYDTPGTPTNVWNNWDVAMANTSTNAFVDGTSWISGLNTVFSGTINIPATGGQWMTIPLSTPFLWDGTSNIVVSVHETVPGYAPVYSAWRNTVVGAPTDYRTLLFYDDNNNPNPASPPAANQYDNSYPDIQFSFVSTTMCSGAPAAGNATSTATSVCQNTSFDLNLNGSTPTLGYTYQWQSSPNGTTWTNLGGPMTADPMMTVGSQTATTYYQCVTTCTASAQSSTSTPVMVSLTPAINCHCMPNFPNYMVDCTQDKINSFSVANVVSQGSNCDAYGFSDSTISNYTTVNITAGNTYTFSADIALSGSNGNGAVGAWIDYNDNSVFDANEFISLGVGATGTYSTTFTVPVYTPAGAVRMRLKLDAYYASSPNIDPCSADAGSLGQVLDYKVNITASTPCAGTPAAGTATADVSSACPGGAVNLDLTNFTAGNGYSYQWQSSLNGTTWTNLGTAQSTQTYAVASQTATTYYQCVVTCTNSAQSATSTPVQVTTTITIGCYCAGPSGYCYNGDGFTNVLFETINDTPVCNGSGYSDNTISAGTASVTAGQSYTIATTIGASTYSSLYVNAWIDYDHNGVFDASEYTSLGNGSNATLTGTIAIPFTALGGNTFMRLNVRSLNGAETNPNPCYNPTSYAETVDYSIYITPSPACSGVPVAGTSISTATAVCPNSPFTLDLSGPGQVSNIMYQWQSSPNGSTWTNLGAAQPTVPYTVLTQTSTTQYRCLLTCSAGSQTATSVPVVVTQNAPTDCYCTPSMSCGNGSISNYMFQSINDNPVCPGNGIGYIDNTVAVGTPTVSANQTYTATMAVSTPSPGLVISMGAWLDFNANGIFENTEYTLFASGSNTISTGNIAIPYTAVGGNTRMRVQASFDWNAQPQDPCSNGTGMTVDYMVYITPSTPCSGIPNAGAAVATSTSVCPNDTLILDLSGNDIVSNITYQWQSSPNGSTWTNLGGPQSTVPYGLGGQLAATYYRCLSTCNSTAQTGISTPVMVGETPVNGCYCIPSPIDCSGGDEIDLVQFSNINNPSACSNANGYINYSSSVASGTIAAGMSYTATTVLGNYYGENVTVWIDYDQNGIFDQSEYTYVGSSNGSDDTIRGVISIPVTALQGNTRMRVRNVSGQPLADGDACNNPAPASKTAMLNQLSNGYGETEDYMVTITPPSCALVNFPPTATATASSPSVCASSGSVTLDLSWSQPVATSITYQWSMSTDAVNYNPVGSPISTSSISVAVPQTAYFQCDILCNGSSALTSGTVMVTAVSPNVMASANPTVVCSAENSILTATGAVTYTWSSGVTLSIDTVNPVAGSTPSVTIYSVSGADANGCAATATVSVLAKPSTAISGTVSATSGSVSGYVILYKYEPFLVKFDSTDYTNIQANGSYNFPSVNSTTYIVKAVPVTPGQQITYAPNVISWQNATPLTHSCVVSSITNIQVQTYTVLAAGTGSLSGRIREGVGYVHKSADGGEKPMAPGNPIPGVVVKGGKNPGAAIFAQTTTDANGMYSFANLPQNSTSQNDDYFILVDIPGLDTNGTYYRKITAQVNSYDSLNFVVDNQYVNPVSNTATSVNDINIADNSIKVFPNPANAYVTVEYSLLKQSTVKIEMLDVVGKNMKQVQAPVSQAQGSYSQNVPIDMLSPGMYFMKLYIDGNEATVKLCITR